MFDKFYNRVEVVGDIVAVTGLYIGSGQNELAPAAVQGVLMKNAVGQPYIPGSSIKGVLRSFLESTLDANCYMGKACAGAWGDKPKRDAVRSQLTATAQKSVDCQLAEKVEGSSCLACRLFGSPVMAGKVKLADAMPLTGGEPVVPQVRTGNAIDRDTRTVASGTGALFDMETIPVGTRFGFRLVAENLTEQEADTLARLLQYFAQGGLLLGGRSRSGLGQVAVEHVQMKLTQRVVGQFPVQLAAQALPIHDMVACFNAALAGSLAPTVASGKGGRRMLARLRNEAKLSFALRTEGPLLINSAPGSKIDPTLPDMSFVRCMKNGVETVYLPGSSVKGVFRTRYEQLMQALGKPVCDTLSHGRAANNCHEKIKNKEWNNNGPRLHLDGTQRYFASCAACRLFGSLSEASRVQFADAYPAEGTVPSLGVRHGVGIDRVTGASHGGAKFDMEVVDGGTFALDVRLTNFALYQLRMLLWILEDIDDGMVTFGMGGSRGNGQMRVADWTAVRLDYRSYGQRQTGNALVGYEDKDVGGDIGLVKGLFGAEATLVGKESILAALAMGGADTVTKSMGCEDWRGVLIPHAAPVAQGGSAGATQPGSGV